MLVEGGSAVAICGENSGENSGDTGCGAMLVRSVGVGAAMGLVLGIVGSSSETAYTLILILLVQCWKCCQCRLCVVANGDTWSSCGADFHEKFISCVVLEMEHTTCQPFVVV